MTRLQLNRGTNQWTILHCSTARISASSLWMTWPFQFMKHRKTTMADQYDSIRKTLSRTLMKLQEDLGQMLRELHGEQAVLTEIEVSPLKAFEIGYNKGRVVGFEIEVKASIGDVEITQKRGF